ncbi:MAG TPA: carbonic anhydrase family protein [Longimicrobium sp.]|nr:carbonic anhydrase family protein [Longimicrobium sp.]
MRTPPLLAAAALFAAAAPHAAAAQPDSIDVAAVGSWSYTGPTGPAFWASRLGYAECAGPRQSPVNLPADPTSDPLPVTLNYPATSPAVLVNTGHTVDLILEKPPTPATLTVADTTFTLREVHFHVPSEHTVQGQRFAGEIHAVHLYGGAGAVLTTFIVVGGRNRAWDDVIAAMPGNRLDKNEVGAIDLTAFMALQNLRQEELYSYAGSLTTPACTPNIRFLIRARPIALSVEQIEALASAFARNVRPRSTQPTPITLHRGARP